jgi:predicted short-subunit dehydrogenase-like oxidoreductase (DUF2520 family)
MAGKQAIAIIGPGNLGTALAVALNRAGYSLEIIASRQTRSSLKRAKALAREVGGRLQADLRESNAQVVWFCVPDSQIARVSSRMAKDLNRAKGVVALHSSGALTTDELRSFRQKGASAASVHPMMTFVPGSRPTLRGVPFAIEGDAQGVRVGRQIVRNLKGLAYGIQKNEKPAYHAWATFASPLFTALLVTTEEVARLAGVRRTGAKKRIIPILSQTLANYASFGAAGAFSGPLIRGDVKTVQSHLRVLHGLPRAREVYLALAVSALRLLSAKNRKSFKTLLNAF